VNIEHHYAVSVEWQGNLGSGTSDYKSYSRDHLVTAEGKPPIEGSSDRVFRGSPERWNPEELMLAALSQCHMLSYLHVAATTGVVVVAYRDAAVGTLQQTRNGGGQFTSVTLRPVVTISSGELELALSLHREASEKWFVAASVNFPVLYEPQINAVDPQFWPN
jgi:organic hydroperoxide reductase OsmC/OhrA